MRPLVRCLLLPWALSLLFVFEVQADDELRSGRVIAVQDKPYRMVHEFSITAGVLPADAFYTGLTLGGSYTLHLSDVWSWEAIDFHYSANVDNGLDVTLAERWSVAPTSDPRLDYLAGTHLVFTPLFGKFTFFNQSILHASAHFALGGGIAHFSDGFRVQATAGPGVRLYWGQVVSTRFDIRGTLVPDIPSGFDFIVQLNFSVSFNFGRVRATDGQRRDLHDGPSGYDVLDELYPKSNPKAQKNANGGA